MNLLRYIRAALMAAVITIGVLSCRQVHAQSNNVVNFFQSAANWATSFNTNYTFSGVTLEADTGYKQVTGANAANFVNVQYDIGNFSIDGAVQFSGVGSALNGEELGVGYAVINHYDFKCELGLIGGYDATFNAGEIEPRVTLKKKLTPNTYAILALSLPERFGHGLNDTPTFWAGAGFTY